MKNKQEKTMIDAKKIIDQIIALTLTRHSGLSSEEFLKKFNVEGSEEAFLLEAKFKFLNECTKEMLRLNDTLKMIKSIINLLGENENEKQEN